MKLCYTLGLTLCLLGLYVGQKQVAAAVASPRSNLSSGIIHSNMDTSIRPQDDFFRYVNGHWLSNTEIPADRTNIGAFQDLHEKALMDVQAIVDELSAQPERPKYSEAQQIVDLYQSVMDLTTIETLGLQPLQTELNAIKQLTNKTELANYFAHSQQLGSRTPLAFYVDINAKDPTRYLSHLWQYGLSLPDRAYYLQESPRYQQLRQSFVQHIEQMFKLAQLPKPQQAAQTVMQLETALAQHHWTRVQNRDTEQRYNKYTQAQLSQLGSHFNWAHYFAQLGVTQNDIIINQPSYIQGFDKVFAQFSLTEWQTYATWQLLHRFADSLTAEIAAEHFDFFFRQLKGQAEPKARWKQAVDLLNEQLGEAIGQRYVARHFPPQAKQRMTQMITYLRQAYAQSINELDWMSEQTKQKAQHKLAAFTAKIGYPERWQDYSKLKVEPDELIGNKIRSAQWLHQQQLDKLAGPIRTWEWHMTPQKVNAYYSPTRNEIVFPAAILQPPFFDLNADDAVNYGAIGAVIGHELGHGFDDQGSRYDGEGKLNNWWTEEDLHAFRKRTNKLAKQYSKYSVIDGLQLNGRLTLGENIGDLTGVTIAYRAYQMSRQGQAARIIDGFSGDERFFIGYGQIWRSKLKDEEQRNRLTTAVHSPARFRTNGPLINVPAFYQTFNIQVGDPMYVPPQDRVKIW